LGDNAKGVLVFPDILKGVSSLPVGMAMGIAQKR
jgi:hypothetical protein